MEVRQSEAAAIVHVDREQSDMRDHLIAIPRRDRLTLSCQERRLVVDPDAEVGDLDRRDAQAARRTSM